MGLVDETKEALVNDLSMKIARHSGAVIDAHKASQANFELKSLIMAQIERWRHA